jgi:hypothetical protein
VKEKKERKAKVPSKTSKFDFNGSFNDLIKISVAGNPKPKPKKKK